MRVALIHDDFTICGGGEKLIAILADGLVKKGHTADIYTFDVSPETLKIIPKGLSIKKLNNNRWKYENSIVKRYLFTNLRLKGKYDFFIFSGHAAICAARNNKPNLLYCHNIPAGAPPLKVAEGRKQMMDDSFIERLWLRTYCMKNRFISSRLPESISHKIDALRFSIANGFEPRLFNHIFSIRTNRQNIADVQSIVVNSENIKRKVKKEYGRDATVVYPPIDVKKYRHSTHEDFWISVNRITPLKRIELQLAAFSKMPDEKLLIVGNKENVHYYEHLMKLKPSNVSFLGAVDDAALIDLFSRCKGLLFTAKDEDFGMAPVEAMASGKPVIAPYEGGCKETISNGLTGILIKDINPDKISAAVSEIGKDTEKYAAACISQAKKFDVEQFISGVEKNMMRRFQK
jgi:glycosyltransferase involved in cell wall biosynthesis